MARIATSSRGPGVAPVTDPSRSTNPRWASSRTVSVSQSPPHSIAPGHARCTRATPWTTAAVIGSLPFVISLPRQAAPCPCRPGKQPPGRTVSLLVAPRRRPPRASATAPPRDVMSSVVACTRIAKASAGSRAMPTEAAIVTAASSKVPT